MKRTKRHKIKQETPEASSSRFRDQEEHDLAYYIHDRVELMHQVFTAIKPRELKAMAPECIHDISVVDLQELCTEELLGISSKRLCAILDGADPPTDTESSASEHMETISLDSISSDDEILSQQNSKKKHKHRKHRSKKHKRKNSKTSDKEDQESRNEEEDRSKASRAGLTVLELLELQARARAIRAQLQQDNAYAVPAQLQQTLSKVQGETSEDEVEIKEEPAEVVEISSEEEKPNIRDLPVKPPSPSKNQVPGTSKTITKRVNDLIVTVPQTKQKKKIVLNRSNSAQLPTDISKMTKTLDSGNKDAITAIPSIGSTGKKVLTTTSTQQVTTASEVPIKVLSKSVSNKQKKKQKKKHKKHDKEEDHDEITLQLSDTEKMDLLEEFDRKNYENFTSSSEDSESSSESESENDTTQNNTAVQGNVNNNINTTKRQENDIKSNDEIELSGQVNNILVDEEQSKPGELTYINKHEGSSVSIENQDKSMIKDLQPEEDPKNTHNYDKNKCSTSPRSTSHDDESIMSSDKSLTITSDISRISEINTKKNSNMEVDICEITEIIPFVETPKEKHLVKQSIIVQIRNDNCKESESRQMQQTKRSVIARVDNDNTEKAQDKTESIESIEEGEITNTNKDLSEGEITDNEEGKEMQTINYELEVVCVSDEEGDKRKKKKKKEKKAKKEKKSKKSCSNFCESADQNFFTEQESIVVIREELDECDTIAHNDSVSQLINKEKDDVVIITEDTKLDQEETQIIDEEIKKVGDLDDDIYEILEISDDSSCYEFEGLSVSKEPTAAEIVALSAKIDSFSTDGVIVLNEDDEDDKKEESVDQSNLHENNVVYEKVENISWRDRYLGSNKVKRVLTTSNILNALRKKNKELKKKLEESKKKVEQVTEGDKEVLAEISEFVEGSIEHFNTLQGSTKYVDPVVPEKPKLSDIEGNEAEVGIKQVTKEMEKDAKQLLKMYKRLLKYNNMNKIKDPTKKKKKKHKKNKEKDMVTSIKLN